MMTSKQTFVGICTVLLLLSCNKKAAVSDGFRADVNLSSALQNMLADSMDSVDSVLQTIYKKRDFKPFWIANNGFSDNYKAFSAKVMNMENQGLCRLFAPDSTLDKNISVDSLLKLEFYLNKKYIKYCNTIHYGVINPAVDSLTNYNFAVETPTAAFEKECFDNLDKNNLSAFLKKIEPQSPDYKALIETRKHFASLPDSIYKAISAKDSVKKIDINLERMRWTPVIPLTDRYIRVNIANQTLAAYRADTVALRCKVCVGKMPENLTPFLHSQINYISLNPKWGVPKSILVKEIAPAAARNSNYFSRRNMRVYHKGEEIDPATVNWKAVTEKYAPYVVVQDDGDHNSLGRIKFNFPNQFAVYLHDTNVKSAFNHANRTISHGCVRVEKPLELAYFCLPPMNAKNLALMKDKILFSIDRQVLTKENKKLAAENPDALKINFLTINPKIPIYLEYYTCYVNEHGKTVFCNDVYRLDNELYNKFLKKQKNDAN